jgi:hypothetical protein
MSERVLIIKLTKGPRTMILKHHTLINYCHHLRTSETARTVPPACLWKYGIPVLCRPHSAYMQNVLTITKSALSSCTPPPFLFYRNASGSNVVLG